MKYLLFVAAFCATVTKTNGQAVADSVIHKPKRKITTRVPIASVNKLECDSTYLLSTVSFEPDKHEFRPGCDGDTYLLYQLLTANPLLKIVIEGHVCCISADAKDALDVETKEVALSVNRAKEIYQCLINRGIDSSRIRYTGLGKRKPLIANEKNEEEAAMNRRVEIRVIDN